MNSVRALRRIIETYTKWRLRVSPEYATGVDVHDYNDALEEQSIDAYRERYNTCCGKKHPKSSLVSSGIV